MATVRFTDLSRLHLGLFNRRLPVFLQTEASECGLACLAMIASYHGHQTDVATLRGRFSISMKGATLDMLMRMADRLGLTSRPLRLELEELPRLKCPVILHWDFNHFLVLKQADKNKVVLHDPASGVRVLKYGEMSRHFTGIALELEPSFQFKKQEDRQTIRLRGLMGKVRGLKRSMLQILTLAGALEVFAIISPLFMQWVVDEALVSADRDLLTMLAIGFAMIVIIRVAIRTLRSWMVLYMGTQLRLQWFANVFTHLVKLPMSYFEHRYIGDVVSRFDSTSKIQRTLTTSFIEAILDGIMAIVTLVMMLTYSPMLTGVVSIGILLYGLLRMARYRPLRSATEAEIVNAAKEQSHFLETIRGIQSIKLFNRQDYRRSQWLTRAVDTINAGIRTEKLQLLFSSTNRLIFGLEAILVVWLGAHAVLNNQFSIGMLLAFIAYKDQFVTRISSLIDKWYELKMLRLYGERLADIVLTEPDKDGDINFLAKEAISPSIVLDNVSFRYAESEPFVLQDLNIAIGEREFVAIVGPSGCGKTTLLKIMLGLLSPTSGTVRIGNIDMNQLGLHHYRTMIATVMQDDQLFAGSIADNICFFDSTPNQAWIEECANMAGIHDDIKPMSMGYNTLIGDMGTALSGGQKQRILLARALYKRPKLLFLDEATSHLDIGLEQMVNQAIRALNLTRVVIAHRPQTIAMAQRTIQLGEQRLLTQIEHDQFAASQEGVHKNVSQEKPGAERQLMQKTKEEAVVQLETQLQEIQQRSEEKRRENDDLSEKLLLAQKAGDELTAQNELLSSEVKELTDKINTLKEENASHLKTLEAQVTEKLGAYEETISTIEAQVDQLESTIEEINASLEQANKEKEDLEAKLMESEQQYLEEVGGKNTELASLKEALEKLSRELEEERTVRMKYESKSKEVFDNFVKEAQSNLQEETKVRCQAEEELKKARASLEEFKASLEKSEEVKNIKGKLKEQILKAQERMDQLREELDGKNQLFEDKGPELQVKERGLQDAYSQRYQSPEKMHDLKVKQEEPNSVLKEQFSSLSEEPGTKNSQIEELNHRNRELEEASADTFKTTETKKGEPGIAQKLERSPKIEEVPPEREELGAGELELGQPPEILDGRDLGDIPSLINSEQYAQAEQSIEQMLEHEPEDAEAWLLIGEVYLNQEKLQEAEISYGKALELSPGNSQAYIGKGVVAQNRGNNELAINMFDMAVFDMAISSDPGNAEAHGFMGVSYFTQSRFDLALESFEKSLSIKPNNSDILTLKRHSLMALGNDERAMRVFEDILELDHQNEDGVR